MLAIGLLTGAASVADILLNERQKRRLADLSVKAWYYIDIAKGRSMLAWINRNKSKKYLLMLAALLVSLFTIWAILKRDARQGSINNAYGTLSVIVVPSCLFGLIAFNIILKASTPLGALLRASAWLAVFLIPVASVMVFANQYKETLLPVSERITITQMLFVIAFVSSILSTAVLGIFWAVAAIPVALIYLGIMSLTTAEFLTRRIAESSKGPLLAFATFVTFAGAWLRFF